MARFYNPSGAYLQLCTQKGQAPLKEPAPECLSRAEAAAKIYAGSAAFACWITALKAPPSFMARSAIALR
ncbi:MAG: hypothetical protein ACOVQY_12010, partial [Erythrobacter sp.]